ncbi:hypothetical protein [Bacillus sp. JJ1122]|uniref:hypothetical protein n=1 Tax=Bacillus sp. JJ1122 TaxID=3122951 RepID=UPI002FFE70EB
MMTLLNHNRPYEVFLHGKEKRTIKIEAEIDVSQMESHVENEEASIVNLMIKSGQKIRKL